MRTRLLDRQILGLIAALAASAVLLLVSSTEQRPASSAPVPAALAWAHAQAATIPATLPDGTTYQPELFLDARTSIGTAPSPDGTSLRLVRRGADGSVRPLRHLPLAKSPFFGNVTAEGDVLAWAEGTGGGHPQLWTMDLTDGRPPRRVTADTGEATLDDSQDSLTLRDGRLYWVASDPDRVDVSQIRSVPLTGGPVQRQTERGTWQWSTWPWLVNGATRPGGSTLLRNTVTHQDVAVHRTPGLQTTTCGPTWCEVLALASDGSSHLELRHPDGSGRQRIGGDKAVPALSEVVPLDRFAVVSQGGPNSDLTRNAQLLVFELATRRTVELSSDAANVFYHGGVLWWSNGNQDATLWHTLDLRTV